MSKITTWYVETVTYLRGNVTIVRGTSYHLLGSQISWDLKIRFQFQVESYISDWGFSESRHLASYVSCHIDMAYDTAFASHQATAFFCGAASHPEPPPLVELSSLVTHPVASPLFTLWPTPNNNGILGITRKLLMRRANFLHLNRTKQ